MGKGHFGLLASQSRGADAEIVDAYADAVHHTTVGPSSYADDTVEQD
jgi:hypothetical protein